MKQNSPEALAKAFVRVIRRHISLFYLLATLPTTPFFNT
jgi:hypothetical protein